MGLLYAFTTHGLGETDSGNKTRNKLGARSKRSQSN